MKTKSKALLLASVFAIVAGAAAAENLRAERYDYPGSRWYGPPIADNHRPDWYRRWQLKRLYHQPPGYAPDYRNCFPGACRDNPYY